MNLVAESNPDGKEPCWQLDGERVFWLCYNQYNIILSYYNRKLEVTVVVEAHRALRRPSELTVRRGL
jgi:hypothetical protein